MSGKIRGSGSASAEATFERTVTESVRRSKMLAQHDVTFVPPIDDVSSIIAAEMFSRSAVAPTAAKKTLTFGEHLTSGDASYDGSADATITPDATDVNTPSTIVSRDADGSFQAEVITVTDLIANANVTANGGTVHGLHLTGGDVVSSGDISTTGGTVHGLHVTGGDATMSGGIASTGGTVSGVHGSFGDVSTTGNIASSGGTVSGLHSIFGDIRINIAATANVFGDSTHTIPVSINGTTYLLMLHT